MNKLEKMIKSSIGKLTLLSIISALIIIAGVVMLAVFGFSTSATNDDVNTLTVRVNKFAYDNNIEEIVDICDDVFAEKGISEKYVIKGGMSGDESELVYVFDVETDLTGAVGALSEKFDQATAADGTNALAGANVSVMAHTEKNLDKLSTNALVRTVIAGVAFAVLALVYVAIRHNFTSGLTMFVTMCVSFALTFALILVTRLPITSSFVYVLVFNLLFTAIATMLTLNKVRQLQKSEEKLEAKELISSALQVKPVLSFAAMAVVALVLIGAIATYAVRMFAIISLLGVVAGVFAALFFAPSFYLPVKNSADMKDAQRARYDYKKGVKDKEN